MRFQKSNRKKITGGFDPRGLVQDFIVENGIRGLITI